MATSNKGRNEGSPTTRASSTDPPEVIRDLLDASMTGDRERLEELLREYPHLRDEFEGLYVAYPKVRTALLKHSRYLEGPEYEKIREELAGLIAEHKQANPKPKK